MNIENKKQVATLLLAIGLGLIAAFLVSQYVQNNIKAQTKRLAQEYVRRNKEQKEQMLQEMGRMNQDFNAKLGQLAKQQKDQEQKILVAARRQQAAAAKKVVTVVKTQSFSLKTPAGKRAVTISIKSLNAVGGLIKSGDFVDIISRLTIPDQGDKNADPVKVTTVLFQDVQVLAVGSDFDGTASSQVYTEQQTAIKLNVTLALDPQEAALLAFAGDNGSLQLSLRSPQESGTKILEVASWDVLADFLLDTQGTQLIIPVTKPEVEEAKEEPPKEEIKPTIQIFKSGEQTSL
jgi:Flp pilus assembly protein CpaB